jgi:hypothetical protein
MQGIIITRETIKNMNFSLLFPGFAKASLTQTKNPNKNGATIENSLSSFFEGYL